MPEESNIKRDIETIAGTKKVHDGQIQKLCFFILAGTCIVGEGLKLSQCSPEEKKCEKYNSTSSKNCS